MTFSWVRWTIGAIGLLLPAIYLAVITLRFKLDPLYAGSSLAMAGLVVVASLLVIEGAVLTAPWGWPRRIVLLAMMWTLLIVESMGLLVCIAYDSGFGTPPPRVEVAASWMAPLDTTWNIDSPGQPHSVRVDGEVTKDGQASLRFELREDEKYTELFGEQSFRTEVDSRDFPPVNSERWYAFSLYVPEDFPKEDNRLVIVQWHGADKWYLGEVPRSPSMAFRYSGGKFRITIRHSSERIVQDAEAVPSRNIYETDSLPLGTWNDFVVQAKWSYQDDGFVNVWQNGQQIAEYRGPVGYNDDVGPYFRFGLYRDATDTTYVAYFSQVRLGETAADVGFDLPAATASDETTNAAE